MSAGKYFHELPKEERDKIMSSGITIVKTYKQPDWCDYPEALNGNMGCWSLVYHPYKINKTYCLTCECYQAACANAEAGEGKEYRSLIAGALALPPMDECLNSSRLLNTKLQYEKRTERFKN